MCSALSCHPSLAMGLCHQTAPGRQQIHHVATPSRAGLANAALMGQVCATESRLECCCDDYAPPAVSMWCGVHDAVFGALGGDNDSSPWGHPRLRCICSVGNLHAPSLASSTHTPLSILGTPLNLQLERHRTRAKGQRSCMLNLEPFRHR